jgi:hypothetical protein
MRDEANGISVSENAFAIVERRLFQCWPDYEPYGHWGRHDITRSDWMRIAQGFELLALEIARADSPAQVEPLILPNEDLLWQVQRSLDRTKRRIARFLAGLGSWTESALRTATHIELWGI